MKLWGGPFQRSGLPDIIGVYEGLFVGIELKNPAFENPKQHVTPNQWGVLRQLQDHGAIVIISSNDDDVMQQLKGALAE